MLLRERDRVGLDAGGGDVVFEGYFEAFDEVGVGHGGVEEGVVDHLREACEGDADAWGRGAVGGHGGEDEVGLSGVL